ncbi:hypothetical protein BASA83_005613 [Batrachochytrium salamandrivorans]|nr:hypothetical protein BASA83_005613 [Batrachochytrium salamandrivorans]
MSSFHNSTADLPHPANLPHPAHHDGSQLLPCDDFHHIPGSNFDEDDIISVNPPDVNVVDAPVVRLKHGRPSSDIWVWFTNDTNSHHLKSTTCKHCNLLINHHKKNECTKLHLNKCNMFCKLINGMKNFNRPDWYVRNKKKCKTVSSSSNTPSSSHQASIKQYALSKLSVKQKQKFHKHMAMHYYATGTSFQRIENLHLKNAIKSLRPDDNFLPNRRQLSSTLLYKCHQEVVAKVDTRMKGSTCCLTTDGWSNINDDPVVNYMAMSPEFSFFLESVLTGQQGHRSQVHRRGHCPHHPKMFHNHHVVKAQLQELQRTTESRVLVRQAPTRWGTIQQMCQRLLDSESHLHTTSSARDFIKGTAAQQAERQKVKDIIADDQFVVKLKKALAIMVPLDRLIVKYQSDKVPISEVMPDFHALPKEFRMLLDFHIITQNEFEYLSSVSHARFVFLYGTAHGLSYLLDPRLLGESLPSDIRNDLETPCSRHPSIM